MKRWTDDMADWRLRQENLARPFPYVYPQMPPRLRRCCAFTRTLLLLEWGCLILMALSGAALCGVLLVRGEGAFSACWDGSALFALGTAAFVLSIPLGAVCRALRHTPKFFWRCPCCGPTAARGYPSLCDKYIPFPEKSLLGRIKTTEINFRESAL